MPNFKVTFRNPDSSWVTDVVEVLDVAAEKAISAALDKIRDKYLSHYSGNPAEADSNADQHVRVLQGHNPSVTDLDTGHGLTADDLKGEPEKDAPKSGVKTGPAK